MFVLCRLDQPCKMLQTVPVPPFLAMYNFHSFRRGSGTILSTFPRIPIIYLLVSFVNRCYRVKSIEPKWSIGRKEESASRACEVRYRDTTPSSIFVSALYPTWEPARMLNNTESFRTALTQWRTIFICCSSVSKTFNSLFLPFLNHIYIP